jgi:histidinol phosphatase-like PHP family hydrolase
MQWYRVDLHLHTPASYDYVDQNISYVEILRKAERQGIDIVAFTDHNTVGGYVAMQEEIERLNYLEDLGRAHPDELQLLAEYRRLLDKILVLPGFEFTATFGFHILGIFSPDTAVREIEHLLLSLHVPPDVLETGNQEIGATSDVLAAYRAVNEAGGICIAAHVNAAHGVAMRGLDFGGQTRIAYTQDSNLHALEATDLGRKGRNTQRFFDGTKPEYPRRMRCIQSSDAHSLDSIRDDRGRVIRWGVGERVTEVLLPDKSFDALLEMFQSNDYSRSRLYSPDTQPPDYVQSAREEGPTMVQSFHESIARRGGKLYGIISDVCAFANTNGGTVYVGVNADQRKKAVGITDVQSAIKTLTDDIHSMISPTLNVEVDTLETDGKTIIRIQVPYGRERPYAIDNSKIYVRADADTNLAIRDEIVNLVRQGEEFLQDVTLAVDVTPQPNPVADATQETAMVVDDEADTSEDTDKIQPPRSGVEIVGVEQRDDTRYYIMRDLRNGNVVKNVTQSSARRLWHYAIKQKETNPVRADQVRWHGEIGLWRSYKKNGTVRYDLVQKDNGVRVYYGATESGMQGPWQQFLVSEDQLD